MDTRTLEILKNDKTTMLSLVEPGAGGEVIAHIDTATVHSNPLREVRRRYNAHNAMLAALQGCMDFWSAPVRPWSEREVRERQRQFEKIQQDTRTAIEQANK